MTQFCDPAWCERQYNARAAIPDHPEIFARWKERSAAARAAAPCVPGLAYGPRDAETLDLFPAARPGGPLLVFIHGGYWRSLDKSDFSYLGASLARAGFATAVINYPLCPAVTIDEIARQCRAAAAWLWRMAGELGYDPARIHAAGHSAGGHLTAMLLATDWPVLDPGLPRHLVKGGLAVSGLYDLEPLIHTSMNLDLRLDGESARRLSPARFPPPHGARLWTAVGGLESEEFQRQNRLIAERWPACFAGDIPMPARNHLTVIEGMAEPSSPLHAAALRLAGLMS